jgi:very-short-patch-repair endonuclease
LEPEKPKTQTDLQTDRARELRQRMTSAEKKLWFALRSRKLGGFKFRRQHPIGPYTLDYFCNELMLDIEIDGRAHDYRIEEDRSRDAYMAKRGILTLRIGPAVTDDDFNYFLVWLEEWCNARFEELNQGADQAEQE